MRRLNEWPLSPGTIQLSRRKPAYKNSNKLPDHVTIVRRMGKIIGDLGREIVER